MEEGADPADKGVRPNGGGSVLGKIGDHQAVVVGTGRLNLHFSQQGVIEVGQFQQGYISRMPEEVFQNRDEADNQHPANHPGAHAGDNLIEDDGQGEVVTKSKEESPDGHGCPGDGSSPNQGGPQLDVAAIGDKTFGYVGLSTNANFLLQCGVSSLNNLFDANFTTPEILDRILATIGIVGAKKIDDTFYDLGRGYDYGVNISVVKFEW